MTTRQAGHFFFEPRGYDHVNQATHEHKEAIKVGYNLRRKVVLLAWALLPLLLLARALPVRPDRAAPTSAGYGARRRSALAGARRGRAAVPHRAPVLPAGPDGRPGVDDQDPHRPVPRRLAVLAAPLPCCAAS
jgi:hypothetical protein